MPFLRMYKFGLLSGRTQFLQYFIFYFSNFLTILLNTLFIGKFKSFLKLLTIIASGFFGSWGTISFPTTFFFEPNIIFNFHIFCGFIDD